MHSLWGANLKDRKRSGGRNALAGRPGLSKVLQHIHPSELEDDIKEFENVAEDLWYVTDHYLPRESRRSK